MPNKEDKKVLDMIQLVEKEKDEIKQLEKPNWKTNCLLSVIEGTGKGLNFHVCSNKYDLVKALGFLISKKEEYNKAAGVLKVSGPFVWDGYSFEDWQHDIKLRINKLQIDSKKKKLAALESRLDKVISPELKQKMELEAIEKELMSDE